jgi:glycosyltransferase involved in cell wall biosynthesis
VPENKAERINNKGGFLIRLKSFFERFFIIPLIDDMITTSHFVAGCLHEYCGREATVIHPILSTQYQVFSSRTDTNPDTQYLIPNTASITLFTHGRLEPGKGIDMLVGVYNKLKNTNKTSFLKEDGNTEENQEDLIYNKSSVTPAS